jgi:nitroreductase
VELQEALRRRKMVRSFRPDPIDADVLRAVLSSVLHAPSAGFTQGNELLVLDDPQSVDDFMRITSDPRFPEPDQARAVRPPVIVLPMANASAYVSRYSQDDKIQFGLDDASAWPVPFWDVDAGMASMCILLAAVEQGLGALFAGVAYGEAELLAHFGVPEQFRPIGFIALGHPTEVDEMSKGASAFTRRRRPIEELLHVGRW